MVSNFLEWLVAETLTEYGTLSSVGVEKRYLIGGSATGGSDKLGIATGVPYLQFCLSFG